MRRPTLLPLLLLLPLLGSFAQRSGPSGRPEAPPPAASRVAAAAAMQRLHFVPNVGQWHEAVRFAALGDTTGWLHDDGFSLRFERWRREESGRFAEQVGCVVRTRFLGAAAPEFEPAGPLATRRHFFVGNDPARHRTDVPAYERLVMRGVLPGIDVAFRALPEGRRGPFEYDLLLAPGAELARFAARCEGVESLRIDADGRLCARLAGLADAPELVQEAPVAWQETPTGTRPLRVAFRLLAHDTYGFAADDLDPAFAAVVDPGVVWGTFLGGGSADSIAALAWQPGIGVWVGGITGSVDFPSTSGAFQAAGNTDGFVAMLADDGETLRFATYLGGSSTDEVRGMALGPGGEPTVVGITRSTNFPVTPGALCPHYSGGSLFLDVGDAFVTRLATTGALIQASTYLGGMFDDVAEAVAIDAAGNAVVVGWTSSHDFPISAGAAQSLLNGTPGAQSDAFLVRIAPGFQELVGGTFLGGVAIDQFLDVALDPATGDAIACGWSQSADFPVTPGSVSSVFGGQVDAVVVRINSAASALLFSTYLGGSGSDFGLTVHRDRQGYLWVGGSTSSSDFPTTAGAPMGFPGGGIDGFVVRLAPNGQSIDYATYLGGPGSDKVRGIATWPGGVVVVGEASDGFPLTPDAQQPVHSGGVLDGFVLRLDANSGTYDLGYGTLLGGASQDVFKDVAISDNGIAVIAGWTFSSDMPIEPSGYQDTLLGVQCGVVIKFDLLADLGEGLRVTAEGGGVERGVGDGERELLGATLENLTDRELHVDAVRLLVGGAGDARARLSAVRCFWDRDGQDPLLVAGPAVVVADDGELVLSLQGASLPAFGTVRLRVVGVVAADPAGFSAEIAAAIVGVGSWTLRAAGGGLGPAVRVQAPGRAVGSVLVLGELPGDVDRDGVRSVVDVRRQVSQLGAVDRAVDADGDGIITPADVDATREALLGRAVVFGAPAALVRGGFCTLRGSFPAGIAVQATLGGLALPIGTVTPREAIVFVPTDHPSGLQELRVLAGGRVVRSALVDVQ